MRYVVAVYGSPNSAYSAYPSHPPPIMDKSHSIMLLQDTTAQIHTTTHMTDAAQIHSTNPHRWYHTHHYVSCKLDQLNLDFSCELEVESCEFKESSGVLFIASAEECEGEATVCFFVPTEEEDPERKPKDIKAERNGDTANKECPEEDDGICCNRIEIEHHVMQKCGPYIIIRDAITGNSIEQSVCAILLTIMPQLRRNLYMMGKGREKRIGLRFCARHGTCDFAMW
eukprot:407468_1